jgi:hypothetical protein
MTLWEGHGTAGVGEDGQADVEVVSVVLGGAGVNDDIVDVYQHELPEVWREKLLHPMLEEGWRCTQAHGADGQTVESAMRCDEGGRSDGSISCGKKPFLNAQGGKMLAIGKRWVSASTMHCMMRQR